MAIIVGCHAWDEGTASGACHLHPVINGLLLIKKGTCQNLSPPTTIGGYGAMKFDASYLKALETNIEPFIVHVFAKRVLGLPLPVFLTRPD
jgi:hypothetical protein